MATFAGGTLRVTTPSTYDAQPAGAPGRNRHLASAHAKPTKDEIVAALEASDLSLVEQVDLTPRRTTELGEKRVSNRPGKVKVEVDVAPGEDAVVLLERDGVYSWHLPTNRRQHTRSNAAKRTARFEIDVQPVRTRTPPKPRGARETRTKGLLGDLVQGAAQALVFRFVAPTLLEKAIEIMEAHVRPGLVHLTDPDVATWRRFDTLDQLHLPTDRPVRVLLFVHGTFSSTVGAFGALGVEENGKGFLRTAISAYDAVIGFDHKTLSVDPRQNARDLLKRLRKHRPKGEFAIDIITHSRGGLVTRAFAEEVLPGAGWPGAVDIAVFVAATNAGTHLADPERWNDLVDLYTNLASVTATGFSAVPGAAPVAAVVGGLVKGIGAFVKYLVSYAAEGDDVPGLQAMVPGGKFVTDLNKTQPGQPEPGTNWFVVSSNFHVELFDDHHNPPEFPRELVAKLSEGFVDQIFEGGNDLVVDTVFMPAIDLAVGGFVRDSLDLGENDMVYHTNYFSQLRVIEAIGSWLPLGMDAGGSSDVHTAERPAAFPEASDAFPEAPADAAMPDDDVHGTGPMTEGGREGRRAARESATRSPSPIPRQRGLPEPADTASADGDGGPQDHEDR